MSAILWPCTAHIAKGATCAPPGRNLIGSTTINTTYSGAWMEDMLYYPWGEQWQADGTPFEYHWAEFPAGANGALFRSYYDSLGRWYTPDPLGGEITNPQSLNRYAYVLNNPTTLTDPSGLCGEPDQWDPETNTLHGSYPCPWVQPWLIFSGPGWACTFFGLDCSTPKPTGGARPGPPPPKPVPPGISTTGLKNPCSAAPPQVTAGQYIGGVASAATMLGEFLSGLGPDNLSFGPGSVQSQMMSTSPGVTNAVNQYTSGGPSTGLYTFGLGGVWNAGANPVQQFVGSYRWSVVPTTGGLLVNLKNRTSVWSGSYHLLPNHSRSTFGPLGSTYQTYQVFVPCQR